MNTTSDVRQRTRRQQQREAVDVVFENNLVDGAQAERLGVRQAAVIRDVVLWRHQTAAARHRTRAHFGAPAGGTHLIKRFRRSALFLPTGLA